ncbi:MAG: LamG domain-containing protein [Candidatus Aenigmarchaeota archaeon]|nr:LamG domain-containing protein [Candidatus Aenigmarchaeota archaeon]
MKKAITPVISLVMLLLITVGLVGITYTFIQTSLTTQTNSFRIVYAQGNTIQIINDGTKPINSFLTFTIDGNSVNYRVIPKESSLIAYWSMDEGSGPMIDSSGSGNNVNLGLSDTWMAAKFGNGVNFGNDGWTPISLSSSQTVETISMWIKTTANAGTNICFSNGDTNQINICGFQYNAWYSGAQHTINAPGTYNDGNWHFVALTQDASGAKVYVDSSPVVSDASINFVMGSLGAGDFNGGCGHGCSQFIGTITEDDVRVYNRVLSADEIAAERDIGHQIKPQEAAIIKIYTPLSTGAHALNICTQYACQAELFGFK